MVESVPLVITGAGGRLGRLLRCLWPALPDDRLAPVWFARNQANPAILGWNMGVDPAPELPAGAVILHLAGSVVRLAEYRASVTAVCDAARHSGARHLYVASSGAVYPPLGQDHHEDTPPAPATPYGRAKLEAEQAARAAMGEAGLTLLRIGNIAGADALLGGNAPGQPVVLDPVAGQNGPQRSYIAPTVLAGVLFRLSVMAASGAKLPLILNVAQPGQVAMGDLLDAAGRTWGYGPPRGGVLARLTLNCDRLAALMPLPATSAPALVADLALLAGRWP